MELTVKLIDRIVQIGTNEGDLILDNCSVVEHQQLNVSKTIEIG